MEYPAEYYMLNSDNEELKSMTSPQPVTDEQAALIKAAREVVERWDSPNWGGRHLEHTADYINRLRRALAAIEQQPPAPQPTLSEEEAVEIILKSMFTDWTPSRKEDARAAYRALVAAQQKGEK